MGDATMHAHADAATPASPPTTRIIVFARLPVPGRVKTRLAASVGPGDACALYEACARHTLASALECGGGGGPHSTSSTTHSHPRVCVCLAHTAGDAAEDVRAWVGSFLPPADLARLDITPQVSNPDLGEKMLASLHAALASPGCTAAIVVGTDIPDVSPSVLQSAADLLQQHGAVWGPADDGGFYLMGLSHASVPATTAIEAAGLFASVEWSTPGVLQATLSGAHSAGLDCADVGCLPRLRDIDTLADLREWAGQATCEDTCSGDDGGFLRRRDALRELALQVCERHRDQA
ncbi:hypothetical protein FOA52_004117 [Chlamydomonas sp. UWO 241]|nr:hypothetical protein FOA52_004117 [Chlamydomonas sp. UWO 241]